MPTPDPTNDALALPPTYAERLAFAVWYAELRLGIAGPVRLSRHIGKADNTLSKWMVDQPSFDQSKLVADAVGLNALWLHDASRHDAVEHDLFPAWLSARRKPAVRETDEDTSTRLGIPLGTRTPASKVLPATKTAVAKGARGKPPK